MIIITTGSALFTTFIEMLSCIILQETEYFANYNRHIYSKLLYLVINIWLTNSIFSQKYLVNKFYI